MNQTPTSIRITANNISPTALEVAQAELVTANRAPGLECGWRSLHWTLPAGVSEASLLNTGYLASLRYGVSLVRDMRHGRSRLEREDINEFR